MIKLSIENLGEITLKYLVVDLNGTLSTYGKILPTTEKLIYTLKTELEIYILTSDTLGTAKKLADKLGIKCYILPGSSNHLEAKAKFVEELGANFVIAFGNGKNDSEMLKKAKIGIGIMGKEGIHPQTLLKADLIVPSVDDGFQLLIQPQLIRAGLRT